MPLLPRKNNLDYQPDNIIQASKQLTTIALENMKNPLTDPDQPALNALTSQKSLSASMNEFSKLLLGLQTSFIKLKQTGAKIITIFARQHANRQQAENMDDFGVRMNQVEELQRQIQEEQARMRGEGRTKGAKDKQPRKKKGAVATQPAPASAVPRRLVIVDDDIPTPPPSRPPSQASSQSSRSISSAESTGRYGVLPVADYARRMISQGAVADAEIDDPDNEYTESSQPTYSRDDDDSSVASRESWFNPTDPSSSSSSRSSRRGYSSFGDPDGGDWDDGDGDDTNSSHYSNSTAFSDTPREILTSENPNVLLSSYLIDITKQIRYMDLLLISNIKPAVQQLNNQQLTTLSQAYATLTKLWEDFNKDLDVGGVAFRYVNYIKESVNFGSQIIKILDEELNKLKIDLLIVVNSYKQNEAIQPPNFTPDSFWDNSAVREMEGGGRTFTGRNHSGRDIPTIWRGAQKDCAYKYML
jgi:hypothetical protein